MVGVGHPSPELCAIRDGHLVLGAGPRWPWRLCVHLGRYVPSMLPHGGFHFAKPHLDHLNAKLGKLGLYGKLVKSKMHL